MGLLLYKMCFPFAINQDFKSSFVSFAGLSLLLPAQTSSRGMRVMNLDMYFKFHGNQMDIYIYINTHV